MQKGVDLDEDVLCCSICLDPLKNPATIPCGHIYCLNCINAYWDTEGDKMMYSCPQCRQTFAPRPVLENPVSPQFVQELQKSLQTAAPDDDFEEPGNLACCIFVGFGLVICFCVLGLLL